MLPGRRTCLGREYIATPQCIVVGVITNSDLSKDTLGRFSVQKNYRYWLLTFLYYQFCHNFLDCLDVDGVHTFFVCFNCLCVCFYV